jgi:hypothetical protein
VIVVRYADDLVVGFESRKEAERFLNEFQERLAKFGLKLHPDKTRLIEFGRFARQTGYQYHAVPGNWASLYRFRERLGRYWHHALTGAARRGG